MAYTTFFIADEDNGMTKLIANAGLSGSFQHCHHFSTAKKCLQFKGDITLDLLFFITQKPPIAALKALRQKFPAAVIVIVSGSDSTVDVLDVLRASADGYILKDTSVTAFSDIFNNVEHGGVWISPVILGKLIQILRGFPQKQAISDYWSASVCEDVYPGISSLFMFSTTTA